MLAESKKQNNNTENKQSTMRPNLKRKRKIIQDDSEVNSSVMEDDKENYHERLESDHVEGDSEDDKDQEEEDNESDDDEEDAEDSEESEENSEEENYEEYEDEEQPSDDNESLLKTQANGKSKSPKYKEHDSSVVGGLSPQGNKDEQVRPLDEEPPIDTVTDEKMDVDGDGDVIIDQTIIAKEPTSILKNLDQQVDSFVSRSPKKVQIAESEISKDMLQIKQENEYKLEEATEPEAPPKPEPRLVIERLVLTNFKSYAGQQIVGPFNASFSAVVGPNGSGKSNVIDSLLFVFGFRASKMRQSKLSELIHNSETYPNLDFCQVDIYFKTVLDLEPEDEGYDENNINGNVVDIPNGELIVSRKAFRNNTSKYYINKSESSYTIVTDLLKDKGIDLDHKRFLILQGEVESIAQMKPKAEKAGDDGLLEYLEDIIGTSKYQASIDESLKQIEELNEICLDKEMRFEIVEKTKGELEIQKDSALEFLAKEKDLLTKKSHSLQYLVKTDRQSLDKREEQFKELNEKLEKEQAKSKQYKEEVDKFKEECDKVLAKIASISANIPPLKNEQKKQKREKVSMDENIKNSENKKKKSEKNLTTYQHTLNQTTAEVQTLQDSLQSYEQQIETLDSELVVEKEKLQEIKMELAEKTKDFTEEMDNYQKELQPWKDKIDKKQGEIDISKSALDDLVAKLAEIQNEEKQDVANLEEMKQLIIKKQAKVSYLERENDHVLKEIASGESELSMRKEELEIMDSNLRALREKYHEAASSIRTQQTKGRILTALTRLKQSGRLDGFHGRLGDLGVIDDKYDVAVSTAGGSMDEMVIDTVAGAQQALDYIRKNNLGFAKFLVLQKLPRFDPAPVKTPNNAPRLIDLIQPNDPRYKPAFYSAVRETLVADNLQMANQIAFNGGRRREVVTLDGKLIRPTGTMSGGGGRFKGSMQLRSNASTGESFTEAEVEGLEEELRKKEGYFQTGQKEYNELVAAFQEFKERIPQIKIEVNTLNMDIESLKNEQINLNNKINNAKDRAKDIENLSREIAHYKQEISALESAKQEFVMGSKDIQSKIDQLQSKIMEVGGVKLKLQSSKIDSITQRLDIVTSQRSRDNSQITKHKSQIKRLEKQISDAENDMNNCDSEIAKIKESYDEKVASLERTERQLEELTRELDAETDRSELLKEELFSKEQMINELRSEEIELTNKVDKLDKEIKHLRELIGNATRNFGEIEVRDIRSLLTWLDDDDEIIANLSQDDVHSRLSDDEINSMDKAELDEAIDSLEEYMANVKVDLDILAEYARRFKEYSERKQDLNESIDKRDGVKEACEELRKKRLDEFMAGFHKISSTLKEMYQMITMGGNAELELADSLDPFSEGILFSVMPPKKSWRNISNLSGGEKTLSSLALVFALHHYKPTPLYVMDEIDAALDFRNVSIVANYIKERTKNAQFIVISLRNNMFELAKQLVGIYKVSNMTRSITIKNKDILED